MRKTLASVVVVVAITVSAAGYGLSVRNHVNSGSVSGNQMTDANNDSMAGGMHGEKVMASLGMSDGMMASTKMSEQMEGVKKAAPAISGRVLDEASMSVPTMSSGGMMADSVAEKPSVNN